MGCGASSQPAEPTFGVDDAVSACEEVQSFYIDEDDGKLKSHMTNMLELDKPERFVEEVVMKAVLTMVGSKIGVEPTANLPWDTEEATLAAWQAGGTDWPAAKLAFAKGKELVEAMVAYCKAIPDAADPEQAERVALLQKLVGWSVIKNYKNVDEQCGRYVGQNWCSAKPTPNFAMWCIVMADCKQSAQ